MLLKSRPRQHLVSVSFSLIQRSLWEVGRTDDSDALRHGDFVIAAQSACEGKQRCKLE